jgi:glutaredoxin
MDIKIYGTPTCNVCKMVCSKLENSNIDYEYITNHEEVMLIANKLGKSSAPIIELNGEYVELVEFNKKVFN